MTWKTIIECNDPSFIVGHTFPRYTSPLSFNTALTTTMRFKNRITYLLTLVSRCKHHTWSCEAYW